MKPRILFLLQNITILLVWIWLFFLCDMGQVFDLVFEGILSPVSVVFFVILIAACLALSYFYETYAHTYLRLKKPRLCFWIIFAASLLLFITLFGLMQYLFSSNADLFSPQMSAVFILIGALNNLASATILVTFLIFMLRKPVIIHQAKK